MAGGAAEQQLRDEIGADSIISSQATAMRFEQVPANVSGPPSMTWASIRTPKTTRQVCFQSEKRERAFFGAELQARFEFGFEVLQRRAVRGCAGACLRDKASGCW